MTLSEAEFRVKMPCPSRYGATLVRGRLRGPVKAAALTASNPDDILNVNETGLSGLQRDDAGGSGSLVGHVAVFLRGIRERQLDPHIRPARSRSGGRGARISSCIAGRASGGNYVFQRRH